MRVNKWQWTALAFTLLLLGGAQASQAFDFGGLLKELEKPKTEPARESGQDPAAEPARKEQDGGLLGLGESLGLIDKKSSDLLKGSVSTLKAFQPIGYEEERAIGGSLAVQVFNRFGGPYPNEALTRYVNLVGRAVADVSDRPEIDYHFAILNTEHPNAFATPGGYVFISVGLLRLLKNEAELAGVLGHEIAHITRKHALQTIQRGQALKGLTSITLTALNKNMGLFDKVIDEVSEILFTRGLDKELEYEADKFGTEYAFRMGYNAEGLKNFIAVLGQSHEGESSIFSSTHPTPGDRLSHLAGEGEKYKLHAHYPVLAQRYKATVQGKL
jgi:predicted Zn-dependent protease